LKPGYENLIGEISKTDNEVLSRIISRNFESKLDAQTLGIIMGGLAAIIFATSVGVYYIIKTLRKSKKPGS
jgi:hypothetical protein